jgi:hypothetical protein
LLYMLMHLCHTIPLVAAAPSINFCADSVDVCASKVT